MYLDKFDEMREAIWGIVELSLASSISAIYIAEARDARVF